MWLLKFEISWNFFLFWLVGWLTEYCNVAVFGYTKNFKENFKVNGFSINPTPAECAHKDLPSLK